MGTNTVDLARRRRTWARLALRALAAIAVLVALLPGDTLAAPPARPTEHDTPGRSIAHDAGNYMINEGMRAANTGTHSMARPRLLWGNLSGEIPTIMEVTTDEDTPVSFHLPVSSEAVFQSFSGPYRGALSGTAPNLTYTPNPNYNGEDSFSFHCFDVFWPPPFGAFWQVKITINPVSDPPVAHDKSVTVLKNTSSVITLSGSDPETLPADLTFVVIAGPSHGALSGTPPNLTYTPFTGYTGPDSLAYIVADTDDPPLKSSPAVVSITVHEPEVTVDQASVAVNEGQEAANSGTCSLQNGNPPVLSASLGTISYEGAGHWKWSYPTTDDRPQGPVTINADYGGGITAAATFQFKVNNVAPTVNVGPDVTIDEGSTFSRAGSFTDPGADTWSATVDYGDGTGPQPLALNGKTFSLSHVYDTPGAFSVTVAVSDEDGGQGSGNLTLTVRNLPPVASNDAYATSEDVPLSVDAAHGVLANDQDAGAAPLTAVLAEGPSHGSLSLADDGSFTYTPGADWHGSDSFTYRAKDGSDSSNLATVTITVEPVNDAPLAGVFGAALSFNGNNAVTLPDSMDSADLTAMAWIYYTGGTSINTILGNKSGACTAGSNGWALYVNHWNTSNGALSLEWGHSSRGCEVLETSPGAIPANTWQHVAATFNATTGLVRLYLNGVEVARKVSPARDLATRNLAIGQFAASDVSFRFNGKIDEVRIWHRELSAAGILAQMYARPAGSEPGLVGYWTFDENRGNTLYDHAGADGTQDGTLIGSPAWTPANVSLYTVSETPIKVEAVGQDNDGDPLTIVAASDPPHGTVTIAADGAYFTYTPDDDYIGADSFQYTISDGTVTATVTVDVNVADKRSRMPYRAFLPWVSVSW